MLQRFIRHGRAEIGAADPDIDDRAHPPPGMSAPAAIPDLIGERGHSVEHRVHMGHDIVAVEVNRLAAWRTECHVEYGAPFGAVDSVAADHRLDAFAQAAGIGQAHQEADGLVGHMVLGVVEVQAGGLQRESLAARGVSCKQRAQVPIAHLLDMRFECCPRWDCRQT